MSSSSCVSVVSVPADVKLQSLQTDAPLDLLQRLHKVSETNVSDLRRRQKDRKPKYSSAAAVLQSHAEGNIIPHVSDVWSHQLSLVKHYLSCGIPMVKLETTQEDFGMLLAQ